MIRSHFHAVSPTFVQLLKATHQLCPLACRRTSTTCSSGWRRLWRPSRGSLTSSRWSLGGESCPTFEPCIRVTALCHSMCVLISPPPSQTGGVQLRGAPAPQRGPGLPRHQAMGEHGSAVRRRRAERRQRQHTTPPAARQILHHCVQVRVFVASKRDLRQRGRTFLCVFI